ncbi:acyltransferase family protein [Flavobacterium lacus]|uniref:Peptidoglycan/LPS O-acetylase OafA/YrhL n=1 Tax=Flavobacterium lacus TaxID=1353778 RepID=A0A328X114_9FLAO|nr:acyltransferase [Flavobacterium lacus]RAR49108.1 peptidoglycan/LPS O-acetylase OafA/YrhL [Flavobacterium lacus]
MKNSLSSLRFFFSFFVFIGHLGLTKVSVGHAFFIILSGFILTYVYENRLLSNTISEKEFFLKRLIRIYPLHLITLFVSFFFVISEIHDKFWFFISKLFFNVFLLQAFIPIKEVYFSFNGVSWNVSVLLFCYLLFPFFIPFFSKISLKKFTFLIISALILIFLIMLFVPEKWHHAVFYISPIFRIVDFIFGIFLFKLSQAIRSREYNYNLFEIASLLLFFTFFVTANLFSESLLPFAYSIYFWIPLGVLILIFNDEKGIISNKMFKRPLFIFLGTLSYPFYMWHQLFIRFFERFDFGLSNVGRLIFLFTICMVLTITTSYLYNLFEKKYLDKFLKKVLLNR